MANVAQIITENILNKMKEAEEQGKTFRWVKPFALGAPDKAYSYNTMEAYRGINRILLDNNEYLTFNMVKALNEKKGLHNTKSGKVQGVISFAITTQRPFLTKKQANQW